MGVGGLFYAFKNIFKIAAGKKGIPDQVQYDLEILTPLTLAAVFQFIGSILELRYLTEWWAFYTHWKDLGWWAVWGNLLGCFCFLIGSTAGWWTESLNWLNLPYMIGSIIFMIASWFYLILFKKEQWRYYYGQTKGVINWTQQLFFCVNTYLLAVSCVNIVFALDRNTELDWYVAITNFGTGPGAIGMLHLDNVLCRVPEDPGWRMMFLYTRVTILVFVGLVTLQVVNVYDACIIGDCDV